MQSLNTHNEHNEPREDDFLIQLFALLLGLLDERGKVAVLIRD